MTQLLGNEALQGKFKFNWKLCILGPMSKKLQAACGPEVSCYLAILSWHA